MRSIPSFRSRPLPSHLSYDEWGFEKAEVLYSLNIGYYSSAVDGYVQTQDGGATLEFG